MSISKPSQALELAIATAAAGTPVVFVCHTATDCIAAADLTVNAHLDTCARTTRDIVTVAGTKMHFASIRSHPARFTGWSGVVLFDHDAKRDPGDVDARPWEELQRAAEQRQRLKPRRTMKSI